MGETSHKLTQRLWFDNEAEAAPNSYIEIFAGKRALLPAMAKKNLNIIKDPEHR
ncbi:hypothetical protein [Pollutibacter soli]|uniref:hypothetical protein n=1 Tax=Pollutibacter soli TaxID=3034157 RepID=UPI003013D856